MKKIINIGSLMLALALGIFSISAEAAFTNNMSAVQIQAEISAMLAQTDPATGQQYSLIDVATAAKTAGITADMFTSAAIRSGVQTPVSVFTAITVWGEASAPTVVNAAVAAAPLQAVEIVKMALALAPTQSVDITSAAISAGADPTAILAATAAGSPAVGLAQTAASAAGGLGTGIGGQNGAVSPA